MAIGARSAACPQSSRIVALIAPALCLPALCVPLLQVVAYNKMDVPDSSDYWEDVREQLAAAGVPQDNFYAIR